MKIGFYDSGLGGAKTLKDIIDMGLCGDIYFLADTLNCPYGTKTVDELQSIIDNNINYLINIGCKIIVIACNTATSVAINDLRKKYNNIIFIGTEPAVKPALDQKHKKILVMGTTRTISGEKLRKLIGNNKEIILVSADKLVQLIESNKQMEINNYLKDIFDKYELKDISHIVLGCTHFSLIKDNIRNIVSNNIKIIDGNYGIGKNLLKQCDKCNTLKVNVIMTKYDDIFLNRVKEVLDNVNINII